MAGVLVWVGGWVSGGGGKGGGVKGGGGKGGGGKGGGGKGGKGGKGGGVCVCVCVWWGAKADLLSSLHPGHVQRRSSLHTALPSQMSWVVGHWAGAAVVVAAPRGSPSTYLLKPVITTDTPSMTNTFCDAFSPLSACVWGRGRVGVSATAPGGSGQGRHRTWVRFGLGGGQLDVVAAGAVVGQRSGGASSRVWRGRGARGGVGVGVGVRRACGWRVWWWW